MRRLIYIFLLALFSVSCMETTHGLYIDGIDNNEIKKGESSEFTISGDIFQPVVKKNLGCGNESYMVDYNYAVKIRENNNIKKTWIDLTDVIWVDENNIKVTVSSELSESLKIGNYDVMVESPSGSFDTLFNALNVSEDIDTDSDTNSDTGSDTGSDKDSDTGSDTDSDTGSDTDSDTGSDTDSDTGSDTDSDTGSDTDSDTDSDTGSDTGSDTDSDTGSDTGSDTDSDTGSDTGIDTGSDTGIDTGIDTGSDTDTVTDFSNICYARKLGGTENVNVDGRFDESFWELNNHVDKQIFGNSFVGDFDVRYDNNYLYIALKVYDTQLINDSVNPWDNDSVEIYIDGKNEKHSSYDSNDYRIIQTYGRTDLWMNQGTDNNYLFKAIDWSGYYIMEFGIPFTELGITSTDGTLIGFDVKINDDDDGNAAESSMMWYGNANAATDPSVFGTLMLVDESEYPEETYLNSCGYLWSMNTWDLNSDVLISWDKYSNTLTGSYDPDCQAGDKDVFFYISTPVYSTTNIRYLTGFDDVTLRELTLLSGCNTITCEDYFTPEKSIYINSGNVSTWTYVTVSAINPKPGDMTVIRFSNY